MLVKCPECKKEVSDATESCIHCGHPLRPKKNEDQIIKRKTATFQFIALAAILIALLTPKILVSLPCLVIIVAGIISLARKEPRKYLLILSIIIGIFITLIVYLDIGEFGKSLQTVTRGIGDEEYIGKMELGKWEWKVDRYGYSYIKGRVKNNGPKSVFYFKITARYMDNEGNVLDSAYTNCAEELPPNMSKAYEIMHKYTSEYKKATIFVSEVRTR